MMIDVGDNCRRAFDHRHLTGAAQPAYRRRRRRAGPSAGAGRLLAARRGRGLCLLASSRYSVLPTLLTRARAREQNHRRLVESV